MQDLRVTALSSPLFFASLVQGVILSVLTALALFSFSMLVKKLKDVKIGVESQWGGLTGSSQWHLTASTTWMLLMLSFLGLAILQGNLLAENLLPPGDEAPEEDASP